MSLDSRNRDVEITCDCRPCLATRDQREDLALAARGRGRQLFMCENCACPHGRAAHRSASGSWLPVAYDEDLAGRIRELVATEPGVTEQRMFGGLAFLIGGNMSVSVSGQGGLLLRCDPAETDALARKPHAARFEMRGRQMDGWLRVDAEGVRSKRQLERWVARGVSYARSLPPKR
jgi:TfoX/Sxy family transcriptional regulator of competence genes